MEMELKVDSNSMVKLLKFLTGGFNGGTDVDKPLELSLKRLAEKEWNQVGFYVMCRCYGDFHHNVVQLGCCYMARMHSGTEYVCRFQQLMFECDWGFVAE
jgi:hypothetical protein